MIPVSHSKRVVSAVLLCLLMKGLHAFSQSAPGAASTTPVAQAGLLERRYKEGEKLSYRMVTSNRDRTRTLHYEIQADGVVTKDASGYVEEFAWSGLVG